MFYLKNKGMPLNKFLTVWQKIKVNSGFQIYIKATFVPRLTLVISSVNIYKIGIVCKKKKKNIGGKEEGKRDGGG